MAKKIVDCLTVNGLIEILKDCDQESYININDCFTPCGIYANGNIDSWAHNKCFYRIKYGISKVKDILNVLYRLDHPEFGIIFEDRPCSLRKLNMIGLFDMNCKVSDTTAYPNYEDNISNYCNEYFSNCLKDEKQMQELMNYMNTITKKFIIYYIDNTFYSKSQIIKEFNDFGEKEDFNNLFYKKESEKVLFSIYDMENLKRIQNSLISNFLELEKLKIKSSNPTTVSTIMEDISKLSKEEMLTIIKDLVSKVSEQKK